MRPLIFPFILTGLALCIWLLLMPELADAEARAPMPPKVTVSGELMIAIYNALKARPFEEVAGVMSAIEREIQPQITVPVPAPGEKKDAGKPVTH